MSSDKPCSINAGVLDAVDNVGQTSTTAVGGHDAREHCRDLFLSGD